MYCSHVRSQGAQYPSGRAKQGLMQVAAFSPGLVQQCNGDQR